MMHDRDVLSDIRVYRDFARAGFSVLLMQKGETGEPQVAYLDGSFDVVGDGGRLISPSVMLTSGQAQGLMDQLYAQGLRPTDHADATPVIDAIKGTVATKDEHLADLRMMLTERIVVRGEQQIGATP